MKAKKLHRIYDDRYGAVILFAHNCSNEEIASLVNKHLKVKNIKFDEWKYMQGGTATIDHKEHAYYILWIRERKAFYTLVHECFHLTWRVFHDRFINCDYDNQEAFAYCQDFYVRTLWRIITSLKTS